MSGQHPPERTLLVVLPPLLQRVSYGPRGDVAVLDEMVDNAVADLLDKVGDDMPPPERAELCRIADQLRQQVRPQQS